MTLEITLTEEERILLSDVKAAAGYSDYSCFGQYMDYPEFAKRVLVDRLKALAEMAKNEEELPRFN